MFSTENTEREKKFVEALQLSKMSEAEREEVVGSFVGLALEAALGRLLLSLSETEQASLELYVDSHRNDENVIEHLLKTYPILGDFLEEELQALQQEAIATMG
jgi:hypothetical protein